MARRIRSRGDRHAAVRRDRRRALCPARRGGWMPGASLMVGVFILVGSASRPSCRGCTTRSPHANGLAHHHRSSATSGRERDHRCVCSRTRPLRSSLTDGSQACVQPGVARTARAHSQELGNGWCEGVHRRTWRGAMSSPSRWPPAKCALGHLSPPVRADGMYRPRAGRSRPQLDGRGHVVGPGRNDGSRRQRPPTVWGVSPVGSISDTALRGSTDTWRPRPRIVRNPVRFHQQTSMDAIALRPPACLRGATRDALLDAAESLLSMHGYRAPSHPHDRRRAGTHAALVNHHFGRKEMLFEAAVERRAGRLISPWEASEVRGRRPAFMAGDVLRAWWRPLGELDLHKEQPGYAIVRIRAPRHGSRWRDLVPAALRQGGPRVPDALAETMPQAAREGTSKTAFRYARTRFRRSWFPPLRQDRGRVQPARVSDGRQARALRFRRSWRPRHARGLTVTA